MTKSRQGDNSMNWPIVGLIAAVLLGLGYWTLRRKSAEAGPWMSSQEAARKAAALGELHGVTVGPERVPGPREVEDRSERAARQARDDSVSGLHRLTISLPAPITPIERGERFEDPIADALGDLGEVEGGGSLMTEEDGRMVIVESNIEVYVKDVPRSLALIRKVLKAQGAPKGTTISEYKPEQVDHPLDD